MFGRKSEGKKAAELEADAKVKRIELERKIAELEAEKKKEKTAEAYTRPEPKRKPPNYRQSMLKRSNKNS